MFTNYLHFVLFYWLKIIYIFKNVLYSFINSFLNNAQVLPLISLWSFHCFSAVKSSGVSNSVSTKLIVVKAWGNYYRAHDLKGSLTHMGEFFFYNSEADTLQSHRVYVWFYLRCDSWLAWRLKMSVPYFCVFIPWDSFRQ